MEPRRARRPDPPCNYRFQAPAPPSGSASSPARSRATTHPVQFRSQQQHGSVRKTRNVNCNGNGRQRDGRRTGDGGNPRGRAAALAPTNGQPGSTGAQSAGTAKMPKAPREPRAAGPRPILELAASPQSVCVARMAMVVHVIFNNRYTHTCIYAQIYKL